jgi:Fe-Mn family superoxide dismutase
MISPKILTYSEKGEGTSPTLSASTFNYHYKKHYLGYVSKLNKLINKTEYDTMSLVDININAARDQNAVSIYNNAAQVWNHEFYWQSIGKPQSCPTDILNKLNKDFGSYKIFTEKLVEAGVTLFGSGWIWLVQDKKSLKLSILKTQNARNPLILNDLIPLLTLDVWEHAYYIDYHHDRKEYLEKIINNNLQWSFVLSAIQ